MTATNPDSEEKINITEHLTEFRSRLIRCFIAVMICFMIAYIFKEKIFNFLIEPLKAALGADNKIIFTGIAEAFFTYIKVALLAGVILAIPYISMEFWLFAAPGLYSSEKKWVVVLTILSIIFFAGGASFGYFFVFPYGFKFLLGFANNTLEALPSMKEYFSFASKMLFAFGLAFELPLVLTGLAKMGIVTPQFLRDKRKYALLIFFVIAAVITPPDAVTQVMMALPLTILYELSIIGASIFGQTKKKNKK